MPVTRRHMFTLLRQSIAAPGRMSTQRMAVTALGMHVWLCIAWLEQLPNASGGQDYVRLERLLNRMEYPRMQDPMALAVYADVIDYSFAIGIHSNGGRDYSGTRGEPPWWASFTVVRALEKMVQFLETRSVEIEPAVYLPRLERWMSLLEPGFDSCDQMRILIEHLGEILRGNAGPVDADGGHYCEVCGWRSMLVENGIGRKSPDPGTWTRLLFQ